MNLKSEERRQKKASNIERLQEACKGEPEMDLDVRE